MQPAQKRERWTSRLGVILAVAGSAVGLGNFLRFPGLAAQYGSGAFMIAYFLSLIILGFPICWAEWTLGRHAGQQGYNSSPGIFHALIRHPVGKYVGVLGVVIPVVIYMYYVYIEAWCLGYAYSYLTGSMDLGTDVQAYQNFWARFVGATENGLTLERGNNQVVLFLLIVYVINYVIIYRGLTRGIEAFCLWAMPALIFLAIIILLRVLTLGTPNPDLPEQSLNNGLGFMWNPGDIATQLRNPQLWLAAAGQIFFSLSVGFGVIITYASYLRETDDVVLGGLTASSANEFFEVGLGGMITVPAAYVFLGAAGVVGQGTFDLGFKVLPVVFSTMPLPTLFGGVFFTLLFLAAVTSSLSMLQPGIAFLEEGLGLSRRQSVALLGLLTSVGCLFVVYFSKDLKALDTIDFWVGTFLIFVMATIIIITFGWILGIDRGWTEAHKGAALRIPGFFKYVIRYVSPLYLLTIFAFWILFSVLGWNRTTGEFTPTAYVTDLVGQSTAFTPSQIRDPEALVAKLRDASDPLSTHLTSRFSPEALRTLTANTNATPDTSSRRALLVRELNAILDGPSIYGEDRFEGLELRPKTLDQLQHSPGDRDVRALNRLLLEEGYPEELAQHHSPSAVARFSLLLIAVVVAFFIVITAASARRWQVNSQPQGKAS